MRLVLPVVLAGGSAFIAAMAAAQPAAQLQPGEILENGGGEQVKVLQCRSAAYSQRECQTVAWKNGHADSNPAWWNEADLIGTDTRVREALGKPPRAGAAAAGRSAGTANPGRPATGRRGAATAGAGSRPAPTGGRIPDGVYQCRTWMGNAYVSLGTVRSVNGSLDTSLLRKVGATFTGAAPSAEGVTISYTTARGYRESMDCKR
jgi:hypothetical protein